MAALAGKEQVFKSLVVLFLDAQRYKAPQLWEAYHLSVARLGNELGSEVVRRLASEINETHAQPEPRKRGPGLRSST